MTQQRIDGKKVWVPISASNHGRATKYHTHKDCSRAEVRPIGLDQLADAFGKCEYCRYEDGDREDKPSEEGDSRSLTCPLCGEETDQGAGHIRYCSGGDD